MKISAALNGIGWVVPSAQASESAKSRAGARRGVARRVKNSHPGFFEARRVHFVVGIAAFIGGSVRKALAKFGDNTKPVWTIINAGRFVGVRPGLTDAAGTVRLPAWVCVGANELAVLAHFRFSFAAED